MRLSRRGGRRSAWRSALRAGEADHPPGTDGEHDLPVAGSKAQERLAIAFAEGLQLLDQLDAAPLVLVDNTDSCAFALLL